MTRRILSVTAQSAPLHTSFTISRGSKCSAETLIVELKAGPYRGRGECVPYARYGETLASVANQIEAIRPDLEAGLDRITLQDALPHGAARCAVDCALWDLEAKTTGIPVWQEAGLPRPKPLETAVTISLDTPTRMAATARKTHGKLLKLKLTGDGLEHVEAVHTARPDARLILDANEGLAANTLPSLAQRAEALGIVLIEQPLPAADDHIQTGWASPVPLCADEAAHTAADIPRLKDRYGAVNIKLDKAGGLTEALRMADGARAAGMVVMVGCMVASSLSMAPAVLLAGHANIADVDGPLWLVRDVPDGLVYSHGRVEPPHPDLWG